MTYTIEIRDGHHIVKMISPEDVLYAWETIRSELQRIFTNLYEAVQNIIENIEGLKYQ